jgi:uncharacterized protein
LALCFDTPPLPEAVEMLGFPIVRLRVTADRPRALIAARVCDIAPGGESLLVTRGVLNLTHRAGHSPGETRPIVPGEAMEITLRLDCAGHRFAAGHRIRLALAPTYWPWVWPSPEPVTLTVGGGAGELELPLLGAHAAAELGEPEPVAEVAVEWISHSPFAQMVTRNVTDGTVELLSHPDFLAGRRRVAGSELEAEDWGENVYAIAEDDPLSAEVRCRRRAGIGRPGWDVMVEAEARMRATGDEFIVDTDLRAFQDGRRVMTRTFVTRVPRRD